MLGFPSAKLLGSGLWGKPKNRLTTPLPHKKEPRFTKVSKHNSYIIKIHQRRFWAHHIPIPHHPKKKNTRHVKHLVCPILSSLKDTYSQLTQRYKHCGKTKPTRKHPAGLCHLVAPRILYFGVYHLPTLPPQKNIIYHVII